ncbi:MAG: sporulation transcriptional regulator SpoIIID [Clostridia bacterium]|nr:sporulation transcriptional regulator SpoIIID [Clostridia bacterium]
MEYDTISRIIEEAEYIAQTRSTVRQTAGKFMVCKSTVHTDMTERLKKIDLCLFEDVQKVLRLNLSQRHLRGGLATKRKKSKLCNL